MVGKDVWRIGDMQQDGNLVIIILSGVRNNKKLIIIFS
jgi:hypothetical protein